MLLQTWALRVYFLFFPLSPLCSRRTRAVGCHLPVFSSSWRPGEPFLFHCSFRKCVLCPFLGEPAWDSVCWPRCVSALPSTQIHRLRTSSGGKGWRGAFRCRLNTVCCLQKKSPVYQDAHSLSENRKTYLSLLGPAPCAIWGYSWRSF